MRRQGPVAEGEAAARLKRLFAPVSKDLRIEASLLDVLPRLDRAVLPALSKALAEAQPPLPVIGLYGYVDPEDRDWVQVIVELERRTEPGSDEWRAVTENAVAVADAASAAHPEVRGLWTSVGFDF